MWSVGLNQVRLKIDSDRKDTLFFRDVQVFFMIFLYKVQNGTHKALENITSY